MFDEQNLYANIPDEQAQEDQNQHPNEAAVPALPPAGGAQIPTGNDGAGAWGATAYEQQAHQPGTMIIPTGDHNGQQPGMYYPQQMEQWEPEDTTPEAATRSAGITAVFVAAATGLGYALGGWKGAVAGGVLSGAVANGYRAQKNFGSANPDQKHEAVVSSVFAVTGLGLGAYVVYKAYEADSGGGGDDDYGDGDDE